jgi:protein involved in sex pheromone biosynthesis
MKRMTLAALAAAVLLSACASQTTENAAGQQTASADHGERALGSLFPQKNKNRPDHSTEADKQDMENARTMNAGTNNSGYK